MTEIFACVVFLPAYIRVRSRKSIVFNTISKIFFKLINNNIKIMVLKFIHLLNFIT